MSEIEENRRDCVRVRDRVLLCWQRVSEARCAQITADLQHGILPYNQEGLAQIQLFVSAQSALGRLREKDQDLADFLHQLDAKMNRLLQMTGQPDPVLERLQRQEVTLSGSGLSLWADTPMTSGDILEVHLVLLPSYVYVYCFVEVVNCAPASEGDEGDGFRVGGRFRLILEEDKEKLIQHSFKQQSIALRNRRLRDEE